MMNTIFGDFDAKQFWEESEYAEKEYIDDPLTEELLASVEQELGYKLPKAYVELMTHQNGGIPKRTVHRPVAITGIYSIGRKKPCSLCGLFGSQFWIDEWEYPAIGVYFADCPSAGHDMICLDYRQCGPDGEPQVVHVAQESGHAIYFVAENFESFIRGLEVDEFRFSEEEED